MVPKLPLFGVRPTKEALTAEARTLAHAFAAAENADAELAAFARWERQRRDFATWEAMVSLRFRQDTGNPEYRRDNDDLAALAPLMRGHELTVKKRLIGSAFRPGYLELCRLGGELPFRKLLSQVHLRSPFEPGVLRDVTRLARDFIFGKT